MERVRLTLAYGDLPLPETFVRVTETDDLTVDVVNWNVAAPPAAFLLRARGDLDALEDIVAAAPEVDAYDLLRESSSAALCFLAGEAAAEVQALFEHFASDTLLTVPPIEWNDDATSTFTVVGTREDIQRAVEGVPDGVAVTVEEVGGSRVAPEQVRQSLSPRQREAVETAIDLGYYDDPRSATTDDLGRALDCAPSTAASHLRKAEAKLVRGLFDT